jgi:hypothetical protein
MRCTVVATLVGFGIYLLAEFSRQHLVDELSRWNRIGAIVQAEVGAQACATAVLEGDASSCSTYRTTQGERVPVPWLVVLDLEGRLVASGGELPRSGSPALQPILTSVIAGMRKADGRLSPDASIARPIKQLSDERQTVFAVAVEPARQSPRVLVGAVVTEPTDTDRRPVVGLLLIALLGCLAAILSVRQVYLRAFVQPFTRLARLLRTDPEPQMAAVQTAKPPMGPGTHEMSDHPIEQLIVLACAADARCKSRESVLQARLVQVSAMQMTAARRPEAK